MKGIFSICNQKAGAARIARMWTIIYASDMLCCGLTYVWERHDMHSHIQIVVTTSQGDSNITMPWDSEESLAKQL
eukprot:scaffold2428_cov97-Cylindrotheca_fusiformis.AAC.6